STTKSCQLSSKEYDKNFAILLHFSHSIYHHKPNGQALKTGLKNDFHFKINFVIIVPNLNSPRKSYLPMIQLQWSEGYKVGELGILDLLEEVCQSLVLVMHRN